jgi:hypothetical protein
MNGLYRGALLAALLAVDGRVLGFQVRGPALSLNQQQIGKERRQGSVYCKKEGAPKKAGFGFALGKSKDNYK